MSVRQGNNIIAGLQDISGKANTSLDNVSAGIDFVVESQLPTADNNHTWYRKYKSGWVEQGGQIRMSAFSLNAGSTTMTAAQQFPVAMAATPTIIDVSDNMAFFNCHHQDVTSTELKIKISNQLAVSYSQGVCEIMWEVKGMAA